MGSGGEGGGRRGIALSHLQHAHLQHHIAHSCVVLLLPQQA